MTHIVLCFGGRDFKDKARVYAALDQVAATFGGAPFAILHGEANGADSLSGCWGRDNGKPVIIVPANWRSYGNAAGTMRNGWMIDLVKPTYAVGFPGGAGTADMKRRVLQRGITLWEPYAS